MFKIFILLFSVSIVNAQKPIFKFANDSDAVLLNHSKLQEYKVNTIFYTEVIDSNLFKSYPIPKVKFLLHNIEYNNSGVAKHYEWSFFDSIFPNVIENEKKNGIYYMLNEYSYEYENNFLKTINVSDASQIYKIEYNYINDSILQIVNSITKKDNYNKTYYKYKSDFENITIQNTGIKQIYFPNIQITDLKSINSNSIMFNKIPFSSFFESKFDKTRFLIEICHSKWIFFEINE
ncbi:MAG: hypothetical protein COZ59_10620 [Bacteroidetes bacterium CG_4_8_14_3_um_filter_31_14]|nr:MAG: hypothetical protein COZ59_10620 [Bacteroidetes bacterium CG_4_8_14_3_um_filter_31_14]